jgi:hypothetical protein
MKPAPGRARTLPWFIVAALLSTIIPSPAMAAAKPAAKKPAGKSAKPAAKSAPAKSGSPGSSSAKASESKPATPYEVPSPGGPETPPGSGSSGASGTSTSTSTSTTTTASTASTPTESSSKPAESPPAEAAKEPSKESPPAEPPKEAVSIPEPSPPPPVEEPIVVPEPAPLFVANVGPSTYPGKLRGIEGGSLWLEPSFHGLQWPQMSKSGVGVSGLAWVDSGYMMIKRGNDEVPDTATVFQQGRGLLRVTPTYTNGRFFAQGQVELVGNLGEATGNVCAEAGQMDTSSGSLNTADCADSGTAGVDDLWVRFGVWNSWDVKVGRFRGWELYHTGMGLDPYTLERLGAQQLGLPMPGVLDPQRLEAPDIYGVTYLYDRPTDGLGAGYLAFHAYPSRSFRFEVLGKLGVSDLGAGTSYYGGRPAFILDQGWMKLKVAAEYEKGVQTSPAKDGNDKVERERWGVGGALQFVVDPFAEFGGSFAYGSQATIDDRDENNTFALFNSYTRSSVGGFANVRLGAPWILGGGANFTWQNDKFYESGSPSPNYTAHLQTFVALQCLVVESLYVKAVLSYSRADFVTSTGALDPWSNSMFSGRIRVMYLY